MQAPRDFETLKSRPVEIKPRLPKRLKQTAAIALRHPDGVALNTAASIARRDEAQAFTPCPPTRRKTRPACWRASPTPPRAR